MHAASKKLEKLLQEESISIVHTHILPLHIQTGFLKGGFIKKVWHVHGAMNPKRFGGAIQWFYSTLADWGADLLVPVSNAVAKHYKPRKTPVEVLHNGAHLLQKDYPVRTYASPFKAIIAGVLVIDKGYHLAIEAIHKVRSEGIDVDLYICGGPLEGDYYKQLLSLVERLNLSKNVHFLGWRDDIRQLNSTMHFALHCYSKVEACPLWVIEAQLDGLPVISTRCGGPEELIVQGQTGFLVPSSDTDALALAIKNILHSSSTLNLMSRNAYAHAEKNFTEQVFVERMRNIYARLLQ
jgi:glycosyltransferase involved in cell wall biosynthesis